MCGRFTQAQIAELDREIFKLLEVPHFEPRYNIAPTQEVPIIREQLDGGRRVEPLRWGLIPAWAGDAAIGSRLINARAESLSQRAAFRDPFARQRCLVPADGFYEWRKTRSGRQPIYVRVRDGEPFAFAGLWDRWLSYDKGPIETFTIITTKPNALIEPVHDRMPAILPRAAYDDWLDPTNRNTKGLATWLAPYPANDMTAYPVNRAVNDPKNDGPECIATVAIADEDG